MVRRVWAAILLRSSIDDRRHREVFAQVHLRGIGFGGEALALLTEDLPTEPLELVLEGGDLLGLRTHHGGEFRGAHRGVSVRVDEPEDAALCMSLIVSR